MLVKRISTAKAIGLTGLCAVLAACGVPSNGPSTSKILEASGKSAMEQSRKTATVFDIVDINAGSARLVSQYQANILNRRFGYRLGGDNVVIGVGDALLVTIFEAGVDGLFSTTQSKQTALNVIVQPDGNAAIPYVGLVRFSGRTLEQARQSILAALKGKAVEPDVIITTVATASRAVTIAGVVNAAGLIPLGLKGDQLTEVIAKAGGTSQPPYETYVTLVRGKKVGKVLLKSILDNPSENVYVAPDDQIFLTRDPRTFTIVGESSRQARVSFESEDLNLIEAVALAGGGKADTADAKGFFVFRYEEPEIVERLLGPTRFREMRNKGLRADNDGRYPIVYRIDMRQADSLLVSQTFPVRNRDVIYASRDPSVDFIKFLRIVQAPFGLVGTTVGVANVLAN